MKEGQAPAAAPAARDASFSLGRRLGAEQIRGRERLERRERRETRKKEGAAQQARPAARGAVGKKPSVVGSLHRWSGTVSAYRADFRANGSGMLLVILMVVLSTFACTLALENKLRRSDAAADDM
eukprot:COSAG06_NODE_17952_length_912_cov_1.354244_1_plen_124_part_01